MIDRERLFRGLAPLLALVAVACSAAPDNRSAVTDNLAMPEVAVLGDVELMASVVPVATLPAAIAQRYRASTGEDGVLVIVETADTPPTAGLHIEGEARDLRGVAWPLVFEQIDVDGRRVHLARADLHGPDTLRLSLHASDGAGHHADIRFNRDIPR